MSIDPPAAPLPPDDEFAAQDSPPFPPPPDGPEPDWVTPELQAELAGLAADMDPLPLSSSGPSTETPAAEWVEDVVAGIAPDADPAVDAYDFPQNFTGNLGSVFETDGGHAGPDVFAPAPSGPNTPAGQWADDDDALGGPAPAAEGGEGSFSSLFRTGLVGQIEAGQLFEEAFGKQSDAPGTEPQSDSIFPPSGSLRTANTDPNILSVTDSVTAGDDGLDFDDMAYDAAGPTGEVTAEDIFIDVPAGDDRPGVISGNPASGRNETATVDEFDLAGLAPGDDGGDETGGAEWLAAAVADADPQGRGPGSYGSGILSGLVGDGQDSNFPESPITTGSDVLRGLFPTTPPNSNIFGVQASLDATPAVPQAYLGTGPRTLGEPVSQLIRPEDVDADDPHFAPSDEMAGNYPTNENTMILGEGDMDPGLAVEQLFADLARSDFPTRPGSAGRPAAAGAGADGTPDFNEVDTTGSGSNLFADSTSPDFHNPGGSSSVNVLGGNNLGSLLGPESSIFSRDLNTGGTGARPSDLHDYGRTNVNEIPKMGSTDDTTEPFDLPDGAYPVDMFGQPPTSVPSSIGLADGADDGAGAVSFDLPWRNPLTHPDAAEIAEASGMIDWSLPAGDDGDLPRVSQFRSDDGNVLQGIARDAGIGASNVSMTDPEALDFSEPPVSQRRKTSPGDSPSLDDLVLPDDAPALPMPSLIITNEMAAQMGIGGLSPAEISPVPQIHSGPIYRSPPSAPRSVRGPGGPAPRTGSISAQAPGVGPRTVPSPVPVSAREPVTVRRGGWLAGSAAGLFAGVGVCAAAYFGNLVPTSDGSGQPNSIVDSGNPVVRVLPESVADARTKLSAGDATAALAIFDKTTDADAPADVKAARGQARWLARVQEYAAAGAAVPADDAELAKARADLTAAAGAGDADAAARAALHLGLMKETSGDFAGAMAAYTDAAKKFPAARPVFDAAVARLKATAPRKPAQKTAARGLPPAEAVELARAAVLATILLQAPAPVPEPKLAAAAADEPGLLFWQAVNAAAAGKYAIAIETIDAARAKHDKKRLTVIGRGVNPLTDPAEAIFLKACDDLKEYWTLRRDVYAHPQFGPLAAKDGVKKGLDTLIASTRRLNADVKTLRAAADTAGKNLKDAETLLAKLGLDKDAVSKDLAAAKKALDAATNDADDTAAKLTAVEKKAAAADASLGVVVKELKAKGFLKDGDDPAEALPTAIKTVVTAASSADAKTLRDALETAAGMKKETAAAKAAADKAAVSARDAVVKLEDKIKAAAADADQKMIAMTAAAEKAQKVLTDKLKAEADGRAAEVAAVKKKAATAAAAEIAEETARLTQKFAADTAALRTQVAAADADKKAELARQEAEFEEKLKDVRAGVRVADSPRLRAAKDRAARAFDAGVALYDGNRVADAEPRFRAAVTDDPSDARYWYFLGLAQLGTGNAAAAEESMKKGAAQEVRHQPGPAAVGAALERVQGPARQVLAAYRP
ncbi:MAG: tetratricopeptide repeat protein [Fimbriiglobus sp.]